MAIQLIAKRLSDGRMSVQLEGCPKSAVVELRLQNTMNGKESVHLVDCDYSGSAIVDYPDFGQHIAVSLRVLDDGNATTLHDLVYTQCMEHKLVMGVPEQTPPQQPQAVATDGATLPYEGEAG